MTTPFLISFVLCTKDILKDVTSTTTQKPSKLGRTGGTGPRDNLIGNRVWTGCTFVRSKVERACLYPSKRLNEPYLGSSRLRLGIENRCRGHRIEDRVTRSTSTRSNHRFTSLTGWSFILQLERSEFRKEITKFLRS